MFAVVQKLGKMKLILFKNYMKYVQIIQQQKKIFYLAAIIQIYYFIIISFTLSVMPWRSYTSKAWNSSQKQELIFVCSHFCNILKHFVVSPSLLHSIALTYFPSINSYAISSQCGVRRTFNLASNFSEGLILQYLHVSRNKCKNN